MTPSHRFSKKHRIAKRNDFQTIFQTGRRFVQPHLLAFCKKNSLSYARLGVSIGRKFGPAYQRNRFKRLVREAFRQSPLRYQAGLDVLILPNNANKTLVWKHVHEEVGAILRRVVDWSAQ